MQNIILQRALKAPGLCFGIHVGKKQSLRARTTCVWYLGDFRGRRRCPRLEAKATDPLERDQSKRDKVKYRIYLMEFAHEDIRPWDSQNFQE